MPPKRIAAYVEMVAAVEAAKRHAEARGRGRLWDVWYDAPGVTPVAAAQAFPMDTATLRRWRNDVEDDVAGLLGVKTLRDFFRFSGV